MPTCPHCGATLKAGAKFCARCGTPVNPPLQEAAPARTQRLDPGQHDHAAPPTLHIQDEQSLRQVALDRRALRIGRATSNDIVLESLSVSANHALIEPDGLAHRISDLGSTNGLLSEGRRLPPNTPLTLADGDVVRIGDPATGNFVTLTYHNSQARRSGQAPRSYPLDPADPQITIGRAGNDVVLDAPQVSRQHAVIERSGGQIVLRDLGSTNGTFVNGSRIERHTLRPGDIIQIGAFKLVYDGNSLDEYDQRGALRIDARQLARAVHRDGSTRVILSDVSLSIAPREFVALVGGSGAGKTTLLNALSGYAPVGQGQVLVNGDDLYRNFDAYRTVLGYVPQDDIIHRNLPVCRALDYSARLRLPADTADSEIAQRIERVLDDVEMTAHRDKLVDNLSGGQRKRVSISAELLADPSLFFLDEPTSGLDPGLEKKLMYTLRRLADNGRTVVLVTHATANITQCDHVAFMAEGRLVYFGPPGEALAFFRVTSGDFADIYTKLDGRADPHDSDHWLVVQRDLQAEYSAWQAAHGGATPAPALAELWERRFRDSPQYASYVSGRLAQAPAGPIAQANAAGGGPRTRISPLRQFSILARRYLDLLAQDRRNLALLLFQAPIIGLLLLAVARADAVVGDDATQGSAKTILFMLATIAVWFGIINAAREIVKEAAIYRRERLANLRIGPYLSSKLVVLTLLVIIQSAVLLGLVALKVQLPAQGPLLPLGAELLITTLLTSLAGLALGLAISAFATTPDRAISIVPLALIPQILFAGVIFDLGTGLSVQRMLSWLTISRWAMDAYGTSINLNALPLLPGGPTLREPRAEYLATPEHLASRWLLLLLYMLVCLGLTAWRLRRRDPR